MRVERHRGGRGRSGTPSLSDRSEALEDPASAVLPAADGLVGGVVKALTFNAKMSPCGGVFSMGQVNFGRGLKTLLALSIGLVTTAGYAQPLPAEIVDQRIQNHPCGIKSLQDEFIERFKLTTPDSRGGIDTYILGVKPARPLLYRNPTVPNRRGEIDESALLDSETYFCEFEATQLSVNPTNNKSRSKSVAYIYVVALDDPETMTWRVVQSKGETASLAERLPSYVDSEESCHGKKLKSKYEDSRFDFIGNYLDRFLNDEYGHNFSSWDYEDVFSSYEERESYLDRLAKESMSKNFSILLEHIYA